MSGLVARLRLKARAIKRETYVLYLACRDPRTPWYVKVLAGGIVAYAISPIDLIPDFIPIIGYLDDVIIVPIGIAAALRLVPRDVLADCRARALADPQRPTSRAAGAIIIAIWSVAAIIVLWLLYDRLT